jgi:hypothetical protein
MGRIGGRPGASFTIRQTPILALSVPRALTTIVHGWRGVRETWPAAVVGGLVFTLGQYATSSFVSVPPADVVASLLSATPWSASPHAIEALHDLGVESEKHRRIGLFERCPVPIRGAVGLVGRDVGLCGRELVRGPEQLRPKTALLLLGSLAPLLLRDRP